MSVAFEAVALVAAAAVVAEWAWRRRGNCCRHLLRPAKVLLARADAPSDPKSCAASPDRKWMARKRTWTWMRRWRLGQLVMIYVQNQGAESGPGYYVVSPLCAEKRARKGGKNSS